MINANLEKSLAASRSRPILTITIRAIQKMAEKNQASIRIVPAIPNPIADKYNQDRVLRLSHPASKEKLTTITAIKMIEDSGAKLSAIR